MIQRVAAYSTNFMIAFIPVSGFVLDLMAPPSN